MKRLLTIASLLLLASPMSPRSSTALMVPMDPDAIVRQEPMLDRHSAIRLTDHRTTSAAGSVHVMKDTLAQPAINHETPSDLPGAARRLEAFLSEPIAHLLQMQNIVTPVNPAKTKQKKKK